MKKSKRNRPEVNAGSMADIAFLLLIFFLVSTTILQEKGLMMQLPPEPEDREVSQVHERNIYKIMVNSKNQFLVEGQVRADLTGLKQELVAFIMNEGRDPHLSVSPQKAVISIKTSRGTQYGYFVEVLDEIKGAYYEIYADKVGLTPRQYRALDQKQENQRLIYEKGREGVPMNISIAEPDKI